MLLVCNWKGTSWGFPKGKLNQDEDGSTCAAREVEEECGYRPEGLSEEDSITVVQDGGQRSKMFIVPGVPDDTYFEPIARKEISKIQFFPIEKPPKGVWNVDKFIPRLKRWIKTYRRRIKQGGQQQEQQQQEQQEQQQQQQQQQHFGGAEALFNAALPSSSSSASSSSASSADFQFMDSAALEDTS